MTIPKDRKMYFATSYRQDEIKCLREAQPPHLLLSFAMWRNKQADKCIKKELLKQIGYHPESILIDCGAYTFRHQKYGLYDLLELYQEMKDEYGITFDPDNDLDLALFANWFFGEFDEDIYDVNKKDFCLFHQYLNFLVFNGHLYDYCFAFDKLGNNQESLLSYRVMKALGINVIPVYQAIVDGELNDKDFDVLDYYAATTNYIAIGGTAISKLKGFTRQKRIAIIKAIINRHPDKKYHLLGCLDPRVLDACPELYSFDGQAWLQKVKKKDKIDLSVQYLKNKINWFNNQNAS